MVRWTGVIMMKLLLTTTLFFAQAAPVTINSTTVSGNTITVNTASSHGLSAAGNGQSACLSAPSSVCGVVVTTPTSTQYTLLVGTAPAACSSLCGTSAPMPQIIILNTFPSSQAEVNVTYLLWLTTQQPCPGPSASSWKAANGSAGATTGQNAAITAGLVVESQRSKVLPANLTLAQLQAILQADYVLQQQAQANNVQPCQIYGQVFDSVGWAKK